MPDKQLLQTVALLESIKNSIGLTKAQSKLLRLTKLKLRFGWVPQAVLHVSFAVLAILSYLHLSHLYKIQTICSAADSVSVALTKIESSQRGYLLSSGNRIYLTDYYYYSKLLHMRVSYLCHIIPRTDANEQLCRDLAQDLNLKLTEMSTTLTDTQAGKIDKALQTVRSDAGLLLTRSIEDRLLRIRIEATRLPSSQTGACYF